MNLFDKFRLQSVKIMIYNVQFSLFVMQIGKTRMQVPIRTATCDHLQCFDAITFLMMNERKPTWMCPVCDRPADYFKLIIDG